jgi:arginine N-succinyltransferase
MGQVHVAGELPLQLLSAEGFEPDNFIDIFDGGAILQAHRMALRSYSSSVTRRVGAAPAGEGAGAQSYLVGSTGRAPFRAVLVQCAPLGLGDGMPLPEAARRALDVTAGDTLLTVKL